MDDRFNTIALAVCGNRRTWLSIVAGGLPYGAAGGEGNPIEASNSKAKAGPRNPRSRSRCSWRRPIRPRASRSSTSAPPATMPTRAAQTSSVRIFGVTLESRLVRGRVSLSPPRCRKGGNWELGHARSVAEQPEGFRARHQDDLCGMSNPQDRADVIAFLNQQRCPEPLPAAPAERLTLCRRSRVTGRTTARRRRKGAGGQPASGDTGKANTPELIPAGRDVRRASSCSA